MNLWYMPIQGMVNVIHISNGYIDMLAGRGNRLAGRRFGRDITNLPRQSLQPGKHSFKDHPSTTTHIAPRDAIHDYSSQILSFLHTNQGFNSCHSSYNQLPRSSQVTEKMRQILLDWLVDVQQSFNLKDQTLHLAIIYLQQVQTLKPIKQEQYQLVGITCLWMASKYEQIYPPSLKKYVQVTAHTYTSHQIKQTQGQLILLLNFNLTKTTPLQLLRAHQHQLPHDKAIALSMYLLQLAMFYCRDMNLKGVRKIVAASFKVVNGVYGNVQGNLTMLEGLGQQEVYGLYRQMCGWMGRQNQFQLTAIKRKYHKDRYHSVSKLTIQHC